MRKASVISRLEQLEAQFGRALDPLQRKRDLEEFQRTAEEYLHKLWEYLGEPPENEPSLCCHSESDKVKVSNLLFHYHLGARPSKAKSRGK